MLTFAACLALTSQGLMTVQERLFAAIQRIAESRCLRSVAKDAADSLVEIRMARTAVAKVKDSVEQPKASGIGLRK